VIDLGGKIQSPQRYAQQEPQPGHPNLLSMISPLVNAPAAKPSLRYRAAI
jgi:hypothetical protein